MVDYAKPLPVPDENSQPWFDGCKDRERLQAVEAASLL